MISDDLLPQDKLWINVSSVFEQYPKENFSFIHGSATRLDHNNRTVTVSLHDGNSETLNFHALIIATGASTPSPLLSLNRDETFLRESWKSFREALPQAKRIIIAGGGIGGLMFALEAWRQGHDVKVFEKSAKLDTLGESPGIRPIER